VAVPCRLCGARETRLLLSGGRRAHEREFHRCARCDLVFVPDRFLLPRTQERKRYLLHQNEPNDEGYRRFLSRLADEVIARVAPGAQGLDYGSGNPPVLVMMLREAGLKAVGWDLFFLRRDERLRRRYDFVTCSETAEHFRDPLAEFARLNWLLRPGGLLGVMTGMIDDWSGFADWHYRFDATHICFYSRETMRWIAGQFSWRVEFPRENVTIFRRPRS